MYIEISFFGFSASRNRSCATTSVDMPSSIRPGDEDDALLQQARIDVVGALAAVGLLDHHRDEDSCRCRRDRASVQTCLVRMNRATGCHRVVRAHRRRTLRHRRHIYSEAPSRQGAHPSIWPHRAAATSPQGRAYCRPFAVRGVARQSTSAQAPIGVPPRGIRPSALLRRRPRRPCTAPRARPSCRSPSASSTRKSTTFSS